ncbi:hypothetical protein DA096_09180 [Vibrio rotiferianus]|uniref:hypothetical protein n=2 Tax=Vibrio rotiferianus TaxID=190895 RepID=UPI0011104129|nr:hypothetical protein [Vibrio rotiferianus]TMX38870.1 hypothetical protein DA095_10670 [Vibrio rotiferianus]TMX41420.1 hypothetical protein DA095_07600 [Vibrio rotiferianus]TMX45028.1 hypothetical protein DA093_20565 [Vibrio rotiferianus]TMX54464.1 hypothetical protein DA093_08910 [Vibrio rotiferianus]TMX54962.1 hypothetical protein DA093_08690 [Vibrio rotiferianus]
MALDKFKEFGLNTTQHSESRIKRFRSMLKLLEQAGMTNINEVQLFVENVERELKTEEISNIFNTKFGTKYAHSSARDLFNCLKSFLEQFNSMSEGSNIDISTDQAPENLSVKQVISLAEELNKNDKNPNIDNELKDNISKLILQKMQITISKLL